MATTRDLFKSVTGSIDMISAEVVTAYRTVCSRASVTTRTLGALDIGSDISLDIGYTDDHAVMFSGRIRSISVAAPSTQNKGACMLGCVLGTSAEMLTFTPSFGSSV